LAAALPHISARKMRPLAVTGARRHRLLPEVPTMAELGFKGFDGVQWYGIMGPAKMPAAIVSRLNTEINQLINTPELRDKLASEALDTMPMTSEQFASYIKTDIDKWSRLVKARKIDLE